jgi:hypothetical protein
MNNRIAMQDAIDRIIDCIPNASWSLIQEGLISSWVDEMDCSILEQITGDPVGDSKAEAVLNEFYTEKQTYDDLIEDSLRIIGLERTILVLEKLLIPVPEFNATES